VSEQNPQNPMHNPSTSSDAVRYGFTDVDGLPLDSPEVLEQERRRQEWLANRAKPQSPGEAAGQ
jgi:hypothetical protein